MAKAISPENHAITISTPTTMMIEITNINAAQNFKKVFYGALDRHVCLRRLIFWLASYSFRKSHDIGHVPKPVSDLCRHRRRKFVRLVNANEIVEHAIQRQRMTVIVEFL
jgi:hypothetical protein